MLAGASIETLIVVGVPKIEIFTASTTILLLSLFDSFPSTILSSLSDHVNPVAFIMALTVFRSGAPLYKILLIVLSSLLRLTLTHLVSDVLSSVFV